MCVVALTNLFKPRPPCFHWWWRELGPLKGSPPSPLSSRLHPTAPQHSWHLPCDRMNELKEIQWDTWCSSQGAPMLLCHSTQLCPRAQAQRSAHLGQSRGSKNTQTAVYQDNLSSSPNTEPPPPTLLLLHDVPLEPSWSEREHDLFDLAWIHTVQITWYWGLDTENYI